MTLISFVNLGIAAMTGLFLNMGSVGNSTMNQTVASDEAVESKGCAANFGKRTNEFIFKYEGPDYTQAEVEDLDNWVYLGMAGDVNPDCNQNEDERACVISVSENDVIGSFPYYQLDPNITLLTQAKLGSTTVFHITGANVTIDYFNEEDL